MDVALYYRRAGMAFSSLRSKSNELVAIHVHEQSRLQLLLSPHLRAQGLSRGVVDQDTTDTTAGRGIATRMEGISGAAAIWLLVSVGEVGRQRVQKTTLSVPLLDLRCEATRGDRGAAEPLEVVIFFFFTRIVTVATTATAVALHCSSECTRALLLLATTGVTVAIQNTRRLFYILNGLVSVTIIPAVWHDMALIPLIYIAVDWIGVGHHHRILLTMTIRSDGGLRANQVVGQPTHYSLVRVDVDAAIQGALRYQNEIRA